jgi:hypothetical protein
MANVHWSGLSGCLWKMATDRTRIGARASNKVDRLDLFVALRASPSLATLSNRVSPSHLLVPHSPHGSFSFPLKSYCVLSAPAGHDYYSIKIPPVSHLLHLMALEALMIFIEASHAGTILAFSLNIPTTCSS